MDAQNNVNPISKLSSFIKKYPNKKLHEQFSLLEESFPSHRIIKGDGNCFYRAFAFLYLASSNCDNFNKLFPQVEWSYLKNNSYIQSNQQFQAQLNAVWSKYLRQLSNSKSRAEKEKRLESLFNQLENFDQLMIGYLKSMNYQHLLSEKSTFFAFVKNQADFQEELHRVRTFDQQSQGIEIYSLAHALKTKIIVFYVDQNRFTPIEYMQNLEDKGLFLFYRPGHYDVIYPFEEKSEIKQSSQGEAWKSYKTSFKDQSKSFKVSQKSGPIFVNPAQVPLKGNNKIPNTLMRNSYINESTSNHKPFAFNDNSKAINQKKGGEKINPSKFISSELKSEGQRKIRQEQQKNTYFQSRDLTNNGKYDLRYKQANGGLDETKGSILTSSRQSSFPKAKKGPVIIQSSTNLIQRFSMEFLGLGAILLVCYAVYSYGQE